jgi:hypothetical protein
MHIFRGGSDQSWPMQLGGIIGLRSVPRGRRQIESRPRTGLVGKRRRTRIGWSQRDLSRACGLAQSAICRLETGKLAGVRFGRFAKLVAAMNGLDPDAPHPPRPLWVTGGWD